MNGYEVCETLKKDPEFKKIPVIFVSALSEPLDKVKAFSLGGVDYITKPFQLEEVQARVQTHLRLRQLQNELEDYNQHLEEKVQEQVKEISESQVATILALAKLAEYRDNDTGHHIDRIPSYCKMLAEALCNVEPYQSQITPAFIQNMVNASSLHDIGKVGIPDKILLKSARLTADEFEVMKMHTLIGSQLLEKVRASSPKNSFINMGIEIARSHHEKWDGTGYPDGLKDRQIPISAHILALTDVYDALRSRRPYKEPFTHEETCKIIKASSGTQFDTVLISVFNEIHPEFEKIYASLT